MAVKHRKPRGRAKKIATFGAATATVTALTAGIAPAPVANAAGVQQRDIDLQAGVQIFPPPDQIPDLTGGFGTQVYNLSQQIGAQVITAIANNVSLAALAQAAGVDPQSIVTGAVNDVLGGALDSVLGSVSLNLDGLVAQLLAPVVAEVLAGVSALCR